MSHLRRPMLLGVDAGNSTVKYAVFAGEKIAARFAFPNTSGHTLAEVQAKLQAIGAPSITAVAVASVGPLSDSLQNTLAPLAPHATVRLHSGLELGVSSAYDQPSSLGIDRLLNVLAAHALYGGPIVVADIGTATNFECVGARGEFLGGAICTGPQLGLDALSARSKRLLHIDFEQPSALIAINTSDALKSGAFYGHAHLVNGLLAQFASAVAPTCQTVVTGGYAPKLFPLLSNATHLDPDLTLQGVRLAFEHLSKPRS